MIILNNRAIMGKGMIVYDIHKDIERQIPVGGIAYRENSEEDAIVLIHLYDDEMINGSNWPEGTHHYIDEIMECLRFAEPNLKRIVAMDCKKVKR